MILSMSEKAKKESVSMRVDGRNLVELRAMAESDERSVSFLIDKAIAEFLENQESAQAAELRTLRTEIYQLKEDAYASQVAETKAAPIGSASVMATLPAMPAPVLA